MENCIFCKIINKEIPSYKIYEDEYTYAFLDASKDVEGHTLVIPKMHYANIFEVDQDTLCQVIKSVKKIANHYKSIGFTGVNILNNNGESAEQSVHHLHFHIIPRKDTDGLKVFPKLESKDMDLALIQKNFSLK